MIYNKTSNFFAEIFTSKFGGTFLDANNIVWKNINDKWTGKRSVWTLDFRACWLEDTTMENVKSWWCGGEDADYSEILFRNDECNNLT